MTMIMYDGGDGIMMYRRKSGWMPASHRMAAGDVMESIEFMMRYVSYDSKIHEFENFLWYHLAVVNSIASSCFSQSVPTILHHHDKVPGKHKTIHQIAMQLIDITWIVYWNDLGARWRPKIPQESGEFR